MPTPQTPSSYQHFTLKDLSPGQFSDRNEQQIPPGGAISTSNLLHLDGVIRPRPGTSLWAAPPAGREGDECVHIGYTKPYPPEVSNVMAVWRDASNNLRIYERVGATWQNRTPGGVITNGMADTDNPQSCNFAGGWFFVGGNHDLVYLPSGATVMKYVDQDQPDTALQPPDKPKVLAPFKDRLLVGDCINRDTGLREPGRIEWSDHQKPFVWGGGVGAGTSGGTKLGGGSERITALHAWSDTITALTEQNVYRGKFVGGQRSFAFDILVDGSGCVGGNTLVRFEEGMFLWLGYSNVYLARPSEIPQPIGSTIRNRLAEVSDNLSMHLSRAMVDRSNDLYWMVVPKSADSAVKKLFCASLRNGAWFEGELLTSEVTAFGEYVEGCLCTKLLMGLSDGNIVEFSFDNTSDYDGQNFVCHWESGTFSGEELSKGQSQQVVVTRARGFSSTQDANCDIEIAVSNSLDEWFYTDFGQLSFGSGIIDHTLEEKTESGEFFKFKLIFNSVAAAAHIQAIAVSLIFGPDTR